MSTVRESLFWCWAEHSLPVDSLSVELSGAPGSLLSNRHDIKDQEIVLADSLNLQLQMFPHLLTT